MIPFFDMKARHVPLRERFLKAIGEVIDSGEFSGGRMVAAFESEFAAYCGCPHAVAVGSGTEALWLTLVAMGIGPGDEVITVPMTFAATVEAIRMAGALPVFVDIDEQTYTMDPGELASALTEKTKAILPVHLFGQPAAMNPILDFARENALRVVEDVAQAHGAEYRNRKAGSIGDAGCFSFYPAKNLGAFGEGGIVVTADGALAEKLRALRNHGQFRKNHHVLMGWNARMDAIQAAVLSIKLPYLDEENELRRQHAHQYDEGFAALPGVVSPAPAEDVRHVYHVYAIRARERQRVIDALEREGIQYGAHYPVPFHLQPAYAGMDCRRGGFPISEQCAREFISLPMFPELTPEQIGCVVQAVRSSLTVPAVPLAM
jgi:dTDP-4-amino-4,6-dideoxygalactose transaminase